MAMRASIDWPNWPTTTRPVDVAFPQRPEDCLPWRWQGGVSPPEHLGNIGPGASRQAVIVPPSGARPYPAAAGGDFWRTGCFREGRHHVMIIGEIFPAYDRRAKVRTMAGTIGPVAGLMHGACEGDDWSVLKINSNGNSSELMGLFGLPAHVEVERGLAEFRSGRPDDHYRDRRAHRGAPGRRHE